jgi:hypothetical protein
VTVNLTRHGCAPTVRRVPRWGPGARDSGLPRSPARASRTRSCAACSPPDSYSTPRGGSSSASTPAARSAGSCPRTSSASSSMCASTRPKSRRHERRLGRARAARSLPTLGGCLCPPRPMSVSGRPATGSACSRSCTSSATSCPWPPSSATRSPGAPAAARRGDIGDRCDRPRHGVLGVDGGRDGRRGRAARHGVDPDRHPGLRGHSKDEPERAQWCPVLRLDLSAVDYAILVVYSPRCVVKRRVGPIAGLDRLLDGEAKKIASGRPPAGRREARAGGTMSIERKQDG